MYKWRILAVFVYNKKYLGFYFCFVLLYTKNSRLSDGTIKEGEWRWCSRKQRPKIIDRQPRFGAVTRIKKKNPTVKRICSIKGNSLSNFNSKIHKCLSINLWIKVVQHNNIREERLMIIRSCWKFKFNFYYNVTYHSKYFNEV